MSEGKQYIGAVAVASPSLVIKQAEALSFVKKHYVGKLSKRSLTIAEKVFLHPSVTERHFAFTDVASMIFETLTSGLTVLPNKP